jgi:hypothetical protein
VKARARHLLFALCDHFEPGWGGAGGLRRPGCSDSNSSASVEFNRTGKEKSREARPRPAAS